MLKLTVTDEADAIAEITKNISGVISERTKKQITFCYDNCNEERLLNELSQALIYIIEEKYKKPLIKKVARIHGRQFSEDETDRIAEYTKDFGSQLLYSEIQNYLKENTNISVKGLVNFRLQLYKEALLRESFTVADGMKNIELLREYIAFVPPGGRINVIINEFGGIAIKDNKGKDITGRCIMEIGVDSIPECFSFEELLLSSLIIKAPSEIILHQKEYSDRPGFAKILPEIFPGRIVICTGCCLCNNIKLKD